MQARTVLPKNNHALLFLALAALGVLGLATAAMLRFGPVDGLSTGDSAAVKSGLAYFVFEEGADTLYIADPDNPKHRSKVFVAPHAAEYGVVPSLSPDAKRLVYTALPKEVLDPQPTTPAGLWTKTVSDSEKPRLIAKDVDLLVKPAWSPDGANIVFRRSAGTKGALFVTTAAGERERMLVSEEKAGLFPIGFSRDGENLYYTAVLTKGSDLYAAPIAGGAPKRVAHLADGLTRDWALSPDGTKLAYLQMSLDGGQVASKAAVLEIASGRIAVVSNEDVDAFNPVWTPEGRLIYGSLGEKGAGVVTQNGTKVEAPAAGFDVPLLARQDGIVVHSFSGGSSTNPGTSVLTYVASDGTRRTIADGEITFLGWVAQ
jgi:Tol biopolymer transport system component